MIRITVLLLVGGLALSGCGKKSEEGGGKSKVAGEGAQGRAGLKFPVQVAPVAARDVEYVIGAVGSVEAFETVQVTARVQGAVEKVSFAEGLTVQKGTVLAEIEPGRYQLAVDAAKAAVIKAEAERDDAKAALERREAVSTATPGLIPAEELETYRTHTRTSNAEVEARRVALEQAKLNLRDAYVRAPVPGIIETRTVQTGQYVQPGAVLATLVRRDPLLVRFKVAELDAARLKPTMTGRFVTRDTTAPYQLKLTHVADAADTKSRMIEVTAEVTDSRKAELRPGSFAEVSIPVAAVRAPVIPQTAFRPSERGFLAFVVDDKDVAHERVVTLGMRTADGMVEVKDGLAQGERLVIRGGEALRDGAPVRIVDGPGPDLTDGTHSEREQHGSDGGSPRGAP